MFRDYLNTLNWVQGSGKKRKAQLEPVIGLYAGFRDCLDTAYRVQGTVTGSGFSEKRM